MYKNIFFFVLIFNCICTNASNAGKMNDSILLVHKNVFKIRLLFPIYDIIMIKQRNDKFIGFSYERVLKPKQSICVSFDYMNNIDNGYSYSQGQDYQKSIDSYANEFKIKPEYRYYFNKKMTYPRGFHVGIVGCLGYAKGETQISYEYVGSIGMGTVPTYIPPSNTAFSVWIFGLGPSVGVQYFLGKHKRVVMSNTLGFSYYRNKIIKEYPPLGESYRLYKLNRNWAGDMSWTIGYTFGKTETKTKVTDYR